MNTATPAETQTIHLQYVGRVRAKPAAEFTPGDVTTWNFGLRAMVVARREVSKCYVELDLVSEESGKTTPRRLKKDRLVAYSLLSRCPWTGPAFTPAATEV